jgi:VWFA-related protein
MNSVPSRSAVFTVLSFLSLAAVTAGAQPPASPPSFSESLEVREAQVEVLVTDGAGQPVQGLTREDFQVFEDGQAAEVTSASSTADQPIVLAVFLDETSLRGTPRSTALAGLRRFFNENLRPGDRVLLVRWNGSLEIHGDPTGDAAALGARLDQLGSGVARGGSASQERAAIRQEIEQAHSPEDEQFLALARAQATTIQASLRSYVQTRENETRSLIAAFQQALALLSTLPERKALLYVGGGMPLRPGADLFQAWETKFRELAGELGISPLTFLNSNASRLVQETIDRANAAGVTLNALALPETGAVSAASRTAGSGLDPEDSARALRNLAAGTGGRVVTDVQNPAGFLERTGSDMAGSYLVGYTPPPKQQKKGKHRIEVKVKGGTLAARHREERAGGDGVDPLLRKALAALWTGLETEKNPLKAEVAIEEETQEEDGRFRVTAVVALPLAAVYVQPQENFHAAHLTVAVAARDGKGRISGLPHAEFPVEIPNERLLSAPGQTAGYRFTLHLAPGESVLAVALRDDLSGAQSVVRTALTPGAVKP